MILYRMTPTQLLIIRHLAKRGHAMLSHTLAQELGKKFISINTINNLKERGYIRLTDQGWLITEFGAVRASE